ncbi:hypothetical protein J6590_004622 [Homalodisca vitripennis]|nr:hypothetical protein J6590_004622 [Homalodisca vitripennis]
MFSLAPRFLHPWLHLTPTFAAPSPPPPAPRPLPADNEPPRYVYAPVQTSPGSGVVLGREDQQHVVVNGKKILLPDGLLWGRNQTEI